MKYKEPKEIIKGNLKGLVIDIRKPYDIEKYINKAIQIPLDILEHEAKNTLQKYLRENIYFFCKDGLLSVEACYILDELKFTSTFYCGGIYDWINTLDQLNKEKEDTNGYSWAKI